MTIPYETGTATNHRDLMAKLETFLTTNADLVAASQEWTILDSDTDNTVFKGTGLAGTDEIYWGQYYYEHVANDIYNWRLYGMTGWNNLYPFTPASQPNSKDTAAMALWNTTITYWFVANGRRVIVVCKVGTRYTGFYVGLYIPYVRPSVFPYPYALLGSNISNLRYSDNSESNCFGFMPQAGTVTGWYLDNNMSWNGIIGNADTHTFVPWRNMLANSNEPYYGLDSATYPLFPMVLVSSSINAVFGELDGIYNVPGIGQSAESIITVGTKEFIVFPNIFRTAIREWFAVQIAE